MRIKDLFTVPTGEKVTEKALRRVLISSICSILLCMTCLVSTTWAWFTVSIENTGNVIEIAEVKSNISVFTSDNRQIESQDGVYALAAGKYTVEVAVDNSASGVDAFGQKKAVYVAMTLTKPDGESVNYYFMFGNSEPQTNEIEVVGGSVKLTFCAASWVKPENAVPIAAETMTVGEQPTEETMESATPETTEPSTTPTEPTTEATEPSTEETTEPTSASSEPTTEATTEPTSDPTVSTTGATEPSTEATAAPSTEPSAEATTASTGPDATTDTTGESGSTGGEAT